MANKIKYNSGIDANALNTGNWSVGSDAGMGPSASTGFKSGLNIPHGGYAIYTNGGNARVAANDNELLEILNKLGADSTSVGDAVLWAKDNDVLVLTEFIENIAYDGLIAYLDANQVRSHVINERTVNLLEISGASGLSSRSDIYNNVTKINLGGGKYRFINDGTGGSTIRLYISRTDYQPDAVHTCSISYEDFQPGDGRSVTLDWCDRGNKSFSIDEYGDANRISITASRDNNPHYFFDISIAPNAAITLFDAQVELGSEETPYVKGIRPENNNWFDLTNNKMDAVLNHNTDLDPVDGAIEFDGVNDYATIQSNPASAGSTFTFEVWFRRDGIATATAPYDRIFQKNGGYSGFPNYGYEVSESENSTLYVRFAHSPASGDYSTYAANQFAFASTDASKNHIKMGVWYCAITTVDENNFSRTWVNGQLAGERQLEQPVMPDPNSIYIARGDNREFQGGVSKVRIYNRALTESEALQNYYGAPIVTDNLILAIDAANKVSYSGGNSIRNLAVHPQHSNVYMSLRGNLDYGDISNGVVNLSASGNADANGCILSCTHTGIAYTLNDDFTTMGWIKRTTSNSAELMSYRETWQRLSLDIQDGGIYFYQRETVDANANGSYNIFSTGASVSNARNTWDHFALSKSGDQWSFYKNGELLSTNTFNMTETVSGNGFHIGAAWSDDDYLGRAMNGSVGPVMHYTKALTGEEVIQNYEAMVSRFK